MPADQPALSTAWIAVRFDTDPLVAAHLEHPGSDAIGESHDGDDWREALAVTGGTVERAAVLGRVVDGMLAAPAGVHPSCCSAVRSRRAG